MNENTVNITLTEDLEITKSPYYQAISSAVQTLDNTGILANLNGNCVAASELLSALLMQSGIESKLVECQATVQQTGKDGAGTSFSLVGFDNLSFHGQIDTHVVVVTKTPTPILIDLSISEHLPITHPFIIEKVNNTNPDLLGHYIYEDFKILYQIKKNIRLAGLHQKSILEKMHEETRLRDRVKKLSSMVIFSIILIFINIIFNSILLFLKFT